MKNNSVKFRVGVVGLGYVGLPLANSLGKKYLTIGYDYNKNRISKLKKYIDTNNELSTKDFEKSKKLIFISDEKKLSDCNIFFVTVPTPVDKKNLPDLRNLKSATKTVALNLNKGDIVVYESTVYPGLTEEILVPILEKYSKLEYIKDFNCSYSPERINPGDKKHKLQNIVKVVSASNKKTLKIVKYIYKSVIKSKVYVAKNIKTAEAAKVIENTQRDLNISLINELSIIFKKLDINIYDVLKAASTKWNFINFKPGLVGGHCIGVDPYYLTYKAKKVGYDPKIILAGRKINNLMGSYVSNLVLKKMKQKKINIKKAKILIMGATFKENVPDIRNSKVIDVINYFKKRCNKVDVFDYLVKENTKLNDVLIKKIKKNYYDTIILAVAHKRFKKLGIKKIKSYGKKESILVDVKNIFNSHKLVDVNL